MVSQQLPRRIVFGTGSAVCFAEESSLTRSRTVLMVTDRGVRPSIEPLAERLERSATRLHVWDDIDGEPTVEDYEQALSSLGEIAGGGIAALRSGETRAFLDAVDGFCSGMERLGDAAGLHIVSDVHRELGELVAATAARYKPSGAGGGDMGIVAADQRRTLDEAIRSIRARGYEILDAGVDPEGLVLTVD